MSTSFGIDVGGTFTDLIYVESETGTITTAKVPTTPASPDEGCIKAVDAGLTPGQLVGCDTFLHGTTVGLNALLERRGAVVGLITTRGFRDVLEIRRGDRAEMYNLFWKQDAPLVPRRLRCEISERILADGSVETALDADEVPAIVERFREHGVTSIAVVLINSYTNASHELQVEQLIRESGYEGEMSVSHRVSREYREYERTSTTVIDAFVKGRMAGYLDRLHCSLTEKGFGGTSYIMRSGTGCMRFSEANTRAFETIMSGPVAGAQGAAELSKRCHLGDLITADVGGTSFDTCLILNGQPELQYQGEVIGLPLQTPWVDVRSIGAGGGSVAYVDAGGLLCVGPRSTGAVPGPACYGRGGTEATVTDACFYLGMFGKGHLASGLELDHEKCSVALQDLSGNLGKSIQDTAIGIVLIASAKMANAIREITIERGIDPRTLGILAFGGAGPTLATNIAIDLGIANVIVPPYAGNFSAWGLLGADIVRSASMTYIAQLDDHSLIAASHKAGALLDDLWSRCDPNEMKSRITQSNLSLDLRYAGQEHTLTLNVAYEDGQIAEGAATTENRFRAEYKNVFNSELIEPVEIVTIRAELRSEQSRLEPAAAGQSETLTTAPVERLDAYSFTAKATMPFSVVARDTIQTDSILEGPVLITEDTSTCYVDAGFTVRSGEAGCLFTTKQK